MKTTKQQIAALRQSAARQRERAGQEIAALKGKSSALVQKIRAQYGEMLQWAAMGAGGAFVLKAAAESLLAEFLPAWLDSEWFEWGLAIALGAMAWVFRDHHNLAAFIGGAAITLVGWNLAEMWME